MKRLSVAAALALGSLLAPLARAGQSCEPQPLEARATQQAFAAAHTLKRWLDGRGVTVAVIARRGQNLAPYGLHFSHAGFVLRQADGRWAVHHSLNDCGTANAALFEHGLADFFLDQLHSTETAVVVPAPEVAARLTRIIQDPKTRARFHHSSYSVVAYPFATAWQNSNGWVVETWAAALNEGEIPDRAAAQRRLREAGYEPSVLQIGPLTRLGGRMFAANVSFDDHPPNLRWSDRITVNSGDSLLRFFARHAQPQPECQHLGFPEQVCVLE